MNEFEQLGKLLDKLAGRCDERTVTNLLEYPDDIELLSDTVAAFTSPYLARDPSFEVMASVISRMVMCALVLGFKRGRAGAKVTPLQFVEIEDAED